MSKADICPVCNGTGKYKEYNNYYSYATEPLYCEKVCHGCNGKGWVEVGGIDEQSRFSRKSKYIRKKMIIC